MPLSTLLPWLPPLREGIQLANEYAAAAGQLHGALADLAAAHEESQLLNRLFAVAVLGALGVDPTPAVPVSVVSTLWWSGAEALDDLVDADISAAGDRAHMVAAVSGGVTSLSVLPFLYVMNQPGLSQQLRAAWIGDIAASCMEAAEGQIVDAQSEHSRLTREYVLSSYALKTGAAYARDAVMAARLVSRPENLDRWRQLGCLYGLLRQLHNDNRASGAERAEDLANGTPTLILAHAVATADPGHRADLLVARDSCRRESSAHQRLLELVYTPAAIRSYTADVAHLHRAACRLLDDLAEPGPYRNVLRAGLDQSALLALPN